jgi:hypothetical protein
MSRRTTGTLLLGLAVAVAAATVADVRATPSSGFTATTRALGRFDSFEVLNLTRPEPRPEATKQPPLWISLQKVTGASDLYIQENVWALGGTTGWHTHPGHSLITVTAGTVTVYDGDDPTCTPRQYTAGQGFVDSGGAHVHVIRNEGSVEARTMAVQLVHAGAVRRIDASGNPNCAF